MSNVQIHRPDVPPTAVVAADGIYSFDYHVLIKYRASERIFILDGGNRSPDLDPMRGGLVHASVEEIAEFHAALGEMIEAAKKETP